MNDRVTFGVQIAPKSPLALGNESGIGNFEQTTDFIAGTALRGALAQKALTSCTQPKFLQAHMPHSLCPDKETCSFWKLFGPENAWFGNCYPGSRSPVYPLPLTARTCKKFPGMPAPTDKPWEEKHGVFDIAIEQFVYELLSDGQFPERSTVAVQLGSSQWLMPAPYQDTCPQCQDAVRPSDEDYYIPGTPPSAASSFPARRQVHVGINRARFAAEDSLLFTQETLEPEGALNWFWGRIVVQTDQVETIQQLVANGPHYIGRGRSRGYGEVAMSLDEISGDEPLVSRLQHFNQKMQQTLRGWHDLDGRFPDHFDGTFFTITLHSPALLEEFGHPHLMLTPEILGLPQARCVRAWTKPQLLSGWESAAQLPRRTRLAACTGSVYLFWTPTAEAILPVLEQIEQEGLGEERERGCGQVQACAWFHSQNTR